VWFDARRVERKPAVPPCLAILHADNCSSLSWYCNSSILSCRNILVRSFSSSNNCASRVASGIALLPLQLVSPSNFHQLGLARALQAPQLPPVLHQVFEQVVFEGVFRVDGAPVVVTKRIELARVFPQLLQEVAERACVGRRPPLARAAGLGFPLSILRCPGLPRLGPGAFRRRGGGFCSLFPVPYSLFPTPCAAPPGAKLGQHKSRLLVRSGPPMVRTGRLGRAKRRREPTLARG